ncbi:MAG: hypothetical protein KDC34_16200 [Saprospiraceae bacterium]|nr:hypothetical protein [Saprospiraceae bacterium]
MLQENLEILDERQKGLESELNSIGARIDKYSREIDKLKREHGYKLAGLGMYKPHNDLLTLSPEGDDLELGILLDPRSPVHLTTGILPEKQIDIPNELFADALNNIQIAFLTTPVISPAPIWRQEDPDSGELQQQPFLLTAPQQQGYNWTWLQPGASVQDNVEYKSDQIQSPHPGYFPLSGPQIIFDGWMKMNPDLKNPTTQSEKADSDE